MTTQSPSRGSGHNKKTYMCINPNLVDPKISTDLVLIGSRKILESWGW